MKLAKFIYPMFLVAIGLHGLLLFVPIGDAADADSVEEDIALSELPESAKGKLDSAANSPLGPLPVPDLNVAAGGTAGSRAAAGSAIAKTPSGAAATTATTAARTAVASVPTARTARPRPTATRPTATRPTATRPAATRPATTPAANSRAVARTPASTGTNGQSTASGSTTSGRTAGNNGSGSLSIAESSNDALPSLESSESSSGSSTSLARDVNASASTTNGATTNGATANEPAIAGLIASATGRVSDALKSLSSDFAADVTYIEEGTDVAGLEARRQRWVENISQQANTSLNSGETVEPIELDTAELSYPIEESAQADRRAFRICLEDAVPNDAEVAVLFDSQGRVVAEPEMTLSSGYPAIDKEILARATEAEGFPEARESKAYLLAFDIEYVADSCVSVPKLKK